jgi:hypothetical protein
MRYIIFPCYLLSFFLLPQMSIGQGVTLTGTQTQVTCPWGNDGTATVNIVTGTAPFTFSWQPMGGPLNTATGLSAGSYTVTVTDALGNTGSYTFNIGQPPPLPNIIDHPQPKNLCPGNSATLFATAAHPSTYQWRANGMLLTDNNIYSGTNTNTLNIADVTGLDGTVYDVIVTYICASDTSYPATLTEIFFNTWTGTADSAWSNAANWQCGSLPTLNTTVIIPGSAPHMPLVDIPDAVANGVIINTNGSLGFTAIGNRLEIVGNIIKLGSFSAANGILRLSGFGSQNIPGTAYAALELAGAGIKVISSHTDIADSLVLQGGYLAIGNYDLTMTGGVMIGGDASSFVMTNGTGKLTGRTTGFFDTAGQNFPVGTSPGVYTPVNIFDNIFSNIFSVRVIDGVYSTYNFTVNNETPQGAPLSSHCVDKTWFVNSAGFGVSDAIVSLSWPLSEELPSFNSAQCDVSRYRLDSNKWESGFTTAATGNVNLYTQSRALVTQFSAFAVGTASWPLGDKRVVLRAERDHGSKAVVLSWHASADPAVYSYILERSDNGIAFSQIGQYAAGKEKFEHHDRNYNQDRWRLYYRLQLINSDGTSSFSNTVATDLKYEEFTPGLVLYPNPLNSDVLHIAIGDDVMASDMNVCIVDALGREVFLKKYTAGSYEPSGFDISVGELPSGMYILKLKQDGAERLQQRFTKL